MPANARPSLTPQNGQTISLPTPARVERVGGEVVMEWDEIELVDYNALLPNAAIAVDQKRTRDGRYVVYHVGGKVCTLTLPWYSPYANRIDSVAINGVFVLQETQGADRGGLRMHFFKADEVYSRR